jgi:CRISPR/Cas system-associated exonuclease Cas4 (RecB family)
MFYSRIRYTLILPLCILLSHFISYGQWRNMKRFNSFGIVNYHTQVLNVKDAEKDAKRIITETISMNSNFDEKKVTFNKGKTLFVNEYMVDPLNYNYVYVIHAIKSNQNGFKVINLFFYYIENRLRYFYEIDNNDERVILQWDPAFVNILEDKE